MEWLRQRMLKLLRPYAPRHVAFIMDGNRRWARQRHLEPYAGHPRGSSKLVQAAQWCFEAGVQYVTVFAFAIENFKRSEEEIDFRLMLRALRRENDSSGSIDADTYRLETLLHRHGVRIRIVGALALLPLRVRHLAEEINAHDDEVVTNRQCVANACLLNICVAYAASEELAQTMQRVQHGIRKALIQPGDIDTALFSALMWNADPACDDVVERARSSQVDLMIRTSAEPRLSNFLLWQVAACEVCGRESQLEFVDTMWPDFGLWDLLAVLVRYARNEQVKQALDATPARCRACDRSVWRGLVKEPQSRDAKQHHRGQRIRHRRQCAFLYWSDTCTRLERKELLVSCLESACERRVANQGELSGDEVLANARAPTHRECSILPAATVTTLVTRSEAAMNRSRPTGHTFEHSAPCWTSNSS
ncbi:hypothetical protein F1559_002309 [Cyanidiococcus yangmingshanensis]|uniref:Alkyl transferase n=1 Tax=Cyanidiococcus yangmingshanensis TaxID=2690220 RepID=A0A7J7IBY4_9RHOD|nr:hypothetical protein F1559_002309 [Cyanidiococcus yangmingshanensis]